MQKALLQIARTYVSRELPKWGAVYQRLIGSFERDAFWADAPTVRGRNKWFGFESEFDLSHWSDRSTYVLGRWHDLPAQLLAFAVQARLILDVGANRGEFSLAAAAMSPNAKIIAFEPNPEMVAILKRDMALNGIRNIELHEYGLSDQESVQPLYIPFNNTGSASFGGFQSDGYVTPGLSLRVGDDVLAGASPDLIKIDVEGYELHVIRGLQKIIRKAQPVVITELVTEHLTRCGASPAEVEREMTALGYRGYGFKVTRNGQWHDLELTETERTADVVWLPGHVSASNLRASTKQLKNRRSARTEPAR
jgi:FkbM family methyltransferase